MRDTFMAANASTIIVAYNVARFSVLWKTNSLVATERITGIPVKFSTIDPVPLPGIQGRWSIPLSMCLYEIVWRGFLVNLGLVAVKTWHFLGMRIPV